MESIQQLPDWMYHAIEESFTSQFVSVTAGGTPVALPLFLSHFDPDTGTLIVSSPTVVKRVENVRRHPEVAMLFSSTGSRQEEPPHVLLVQGTAEVDDRNPENGWKRYFAGWARRQSSARESLPRMSQMMPAYVQRAIIRVQPTRFLGWPEGDMQRAPEIVEVHGASAENLWSTERSALPTRSQVPQKSVTIEWTDELIAQIGSCNRTILSYRGQDGYPVALPAPFTFNGGEHFFTFPKPAQLPAILKEMQEFASLTLLYYDPQRASETYLLFYGQLAENDGNWSFTPTRVLLQQWASRRGR
jgi:general stress protein 26